MRAPFVLILSCFVSVFLMAQTSRDILLIPPTAALTGMGGGSSVPEENPLAFYDNPAHLGFYPQNGRLGAHIAPARTDIPFLADSDGYRSVGIAVGFDLRSAGASLPLTIGLGFANGNLAFPDQPQLSDGEEIGTFQPSQAYNGFALGLGLDYGVQLAFGYHYKRISTDVIDTPEAGNTELRNVVDGASDLGLMLNLPFFGIAEKWRDSRITWGEAIRPFANLGLGWTLANMGDPYEDEGGNKMALPRSARVGFSLNSGFTVPYRRVLMQPVHLTWAVSATDLTNDPAEGPESFQGALGDISVGGNLLAIKGDNNVTIRKGIRLRLFEALEISDGRIGTSKTRGLGVSARGLFKLWKSRHIGNEIVDLLAERMSIQYFMAITNRNSDLESTFHGISIVLMAR